MTPTTTLARTLWASIRYQHAQAKRRRLAEKKRVCAESVRNGERAVGELATGEEAQRT